MLHKAPPRGKKPFGNRHGQKDRKRGKTQSGKADNQRSIPPFRPGFQGKNRSPFRFRVCGACRNSDDENSAGFKPYEKEYTSKIAMKYILMGLIKLYKLTLSKILPPCCRFTPTCSEYGFEAVRRFGAVRGGYLTLWRILRCNPFCNCGYDPVPEKFMFRPEKYTVSAKIPADFSSWEELEDDMQ